jgi:hypothetical protein|tara:strand:- start:446 stop:748 length:303 start_codon:yes stop_codon:yes gene_type:complete
MKTTIEFKTEALSTFLTKGFTIAGDIITPVDDSETVPNNLDLDAKIAELQASYDAQEYARKRQAEYPTIAELTIALYDEADKSALVAKRNAVKLKYPKPS